MNRLQEFLFHKSEWLHYMGASKILHSGMGMDSFDRIQDNF